MWNLYDNYRYECIKGNGIDFAAPGGNGIKVMLVAAGYAPNQNTHIFRSSVTNEVTGAGYTAGGNVCANGVHALDGAGLATATVDDPATWAQNASGFTNARRAIIYHDTGVAGTSRLIAYTNDFGTDRGNVTGPFSVDLSAFVFSSPRPA